MIVPGLFVCSSFLISVCMFIVSIALLISSATVIVRAGGAIWVNLFATVLVSVCSAVTVECYVLYPWCMGVFGMFGSVLSPILFNIYTNDQPFHDGTRNFVYVDDLCVTAQYPSFIEVEHTIEEALDKLTIYYRSNSLRANPCKTQVTTFHLKNREANRTLEVKWNNTDLENTPHPSYLGVTLDRTLSYKQHIQR